MVRGAAALLGVACGLWAQTTPHFEAADVHRSGPGMNAYTLLSGGALRGTRYDLRKATMVDLISIAWNVVPDNVVGGPNWLEFDRFDIAAKAPRNTTPDALRLMLQALLTERFKLAVHRDTRPMPAFALTVGKGKPKMSEAQGSNPVCTYEQPPGSKLRAWNCRNMTMAEFAERLHDMAHDYLIDPLVEATGLEGRWDFDLRWHARSEVLPAGTDRLTIFDAIEKQLGLTLTRREAPAPVLVVDRANETPTANAADIAKQLPPRDVEFEVADLKQSAPGSRSNGRFEVLPGGELEVVGIPLQILMLAAWDIDYSKPERFANLPKWIESVRIDIHAKPPAAMNRPPIRGWGYPDDETRLMLRTLLEERYRIKWHYEDRPVDAYTLTAGKPKMSPGDTSKRATCRVARSVANDPRDANPRLSELLECRNATIAQFAMKLQELEPDDFTYPVDDKTELNGTYDFLLSFSPRWIANAATADGTPNGAVPIGEAISKQLGLKLEKRKRMLPVVVIDHMEEKALEN